LWRGFGEASDAFMGLLELHSADPGSPMIPTSAPATSWIEIGRAHEEDTIFVIAMQSIFGGGNQMNSDLMVGA
jgi:hypothetical protein